MARYYKNNELTIYSRDEAKHYYLKKKYPKIRCIIGDIRNFDLLNASMKGHDIGIFAASLKQIEAVADNISEAEQTIVQGAINSRRAAIENKLEAACFISSDKSRAATTLYGAMKFVAGESFIYNAEKETVRLSSVIYGNVLNSSGSVIPLIWNFITAKQEMVLYDKQMTRFFISVEEAIDTIEVALTTTGHNTIPKLRSCFVKDLFEIYEKEFGLRWKTGQPRSLEKIHEQLFTEYESDRVTPLTQGIWAMHYKTVHNNSSVPKEGYSSNNPQALITKKELKKLLEANHFFKPGT